VSDAAEFAPADLPAASQTRFARSNRGGRPQRFLGRDRSGERLRRAMTGARASSPCDATCSEPPPDLFTVREAEPPQPRGWSERGPAGLRVSWSAEQEPAADDLVVRAFEAHASAHALDDAVGFDGCPSRSRLRRRPLGFERAVVRDGAEVWTKSALRRSSIPSFAPACRAGQPQKSVSETSEASWRRAVLPAAGVIAPMRISGALKRMSISVMGHSLAASDPEATSEAAPWT